VISRFFAFATGALVFATQLEAHPHVFVDGGVDFVMEDGSVLTALEVTWLFDKFESLYLLSVSGVTLTDTGKLPQDAWEHLRSEVGAWPDSFSGSAHLSVLGQDVTLSDPSDFDIRMVDTRLEVTFTRTLTQPLPLSNLTLETQFYEASFFYDFSITQSPQILGHGEDCQAQVIPFAEGDETQEIRQALQALGREEVPDQPNVGALFADRITMTCQ